MKRSKKGRLLSLLLCFAMLLGMFPLTTAFADSGGMGADPIEVASVYHFGFETDTFDVGWTSVDEDGDGHNWEQKSTGGKIDGGCIQSASNLNSLKLDSDSWLISPPVLGGGQDCCGIRLLGRR